MRWEKKDGKNGMFDKLKAVESRFEISARLLEPDIASDNTTYRNLMKEYRNLEPVVEKFRAYQKLDASFSGGRGCWSRAVWIRILKRWWRRNTTLAKQGLESCGEELKILLLPKGSQR